MYIYIAACAAVFMAAYLVNTTIISVFYHRGLAHGAVELRPTARALVGRFGVWLTGMDPKGWVSMHRRHHEHSDTARDPHSPVHYGIAGVLLGQLRSYERTLIGLVRRERRFAANVDDLDFPVSWTVRTGRWYLPYVLHFVIALALALPTGWWALGACYWFGMMSHPIEGWVVNSLGHAVGSRNFDTPDNSRNNHFAAWLIAGEGFQNNHHQYPASARFSYRRHEIDPGYWLCLMLEAVGVLVIRRDALIPTHA